MLSSDSFNIVPEGVAFGRAEEIWMRRGWREFLEKLRVCWVGPDRDRNCCTCEKCIRDILTFPALGPGVPPCFDHHVTDEQIEKTTLGGNHFPVIRCAEFGKLGVLHGSEGSWVKIFERCLEPMPGSANLGHSGI